MGQYGEWSKARERQDWQNEWPQGVVMGQNRSLQKIEWAGSHDLHSLFSSNSCHVYKTTSFFFFVSKPYPVHSTHSKSILLMRSCRMILSWPSGTASIFTHSTITWTHSCTMVPLIPTVGAVAWCPSVVSIWLLLVRGKATMFCSSSCITLKHTANMLAFFWHVAFLHVPIDRLCVCTCACVCVCACVRMCMCARAHQS